MANTQDIRRRIKSIRNTAQITKAMQMVAASKMRKAQQHALAGRPYAGLMNKVLVSLQKRTDPRLHPLLHIRELKKELVLIISTDKGLAGALNTNLFREAANFEPAKTVYVVAGKKARQFIARVKRELLADFELKDAPTSFSSAKWTRFPCFTRILLTRSINVQSCRHCFRSAVLIFRKNTRKQTQTKMSIQCSAMFLSQTPRPCSI